MICTKALRLELLSHRLLLFNPKFNSNLHFTDFIMKTPSKQTNKQWLSEGPETSCGHSLEQNQGLLIPSSWKLEGGWD